MKKLQCRPRTDLNLSPCLWGVFTHDTCDNLASKIKCDAEWLFCRILYGRMRTKSGNKFQSKSNATLRSTIVLRFLVGCQPEEMGMFIDLLLEPVCHYAEGTHTVVRHHPTNTENKKALKTKLMSHESQTVFRVPVSHNLNEHSHPLSMTRSLSGGGGASHSRDGPLRRSACGSSAQPA